MLNSGLNSTFTLALLSTGMVCLALPVGATPRRIAAVVEEACKRQGPLAAAWAAQARCGALTRSVPSPLARLTMNALSRKFAVSYAEINAPMDTSERATMWGKAIDYVVYWRPPQANISASLITISYTFWYKMITRTTLIYWHVIYRATPYVL